jgi:hypothetical protein
MEVANLPELSSDNLFDWPDDIFNYSESDTDVSVRQSKIVRLEKITVTVKQAPRKVTILQMRGNLVGEAASMV